MKHFAKSTLIIAFFFGIDKILGFVRQVLVARQFSLSYELDVFNAANNIPDLLSSLISGGALGVALIPVISEYLNREGRESAWRLFSQIVNLAFIVTAFMSVIIIIFAEIIVGKIVAPGFPPEQKQLTVDLMRLDLLAILIFSISGLVMAGLQANQHFLLPALAPGLYNIGQIIGIVSFAPETGMILGPKQLPTLGLGIRGLVYGVILGACLHLLIQVPGLLKYGFRWSPRIKLNDPGVKRVLSLLGPRILTMLFIQLFFIVRDNLASGLGEGSVTALNYGWFIMQVPETLLGTAIAIALLPTISELFAIGDHNEFAKTVNTATNVLLALTIPCTCLLFAGVHPLIETVFSFDQAGTNLVTAVTRMYLVGLVGHALLEIASRSFYAQQNAKIPLYAAALNATGYLILAPLFSKMIGVVGIALANVIVFTTEALILFWLLSRKYPHIFDVSKTFIRVSIYSLVASGLVYISVNYFQESGFFISILGMGLGLTFLVPVILPEIKLLMKLGGSNTKLADQKI